MEGAGKGVKEKERGEKGLWRDTTLGGVRREEELQMKKLRVKEVGGMTEKGEKS